MTLYSHSRVKTFETCPLQYKFKYVDAIPEPLENIETFVGKRVHEVLEQLYRGLSPDVAAPALMDLLAAYRAAWEAHWRAEIRIVRGDAAHFYQSYGARCIENLYNARAPFNQDTTLYLEQYLEFPLGDAGTHTMRGYADRISIRRDGVYEIHDYKTSRRALTQRDADVDRQLSLYEIGLRTLHPEAKEIQLVWHFLNPRVTVRSRRTPERLTQIQRDTQTLINRVESETTYPAKKSALCDWCTYKAMCPAWS
jgi:putative RecB family exonuclease